MSAAEYPHLARIAEIAAGSGLVPADPLRQSLTDARLAATAYQALWNTPLPEIGGHAEIEITGPRGAQLRLRIHYPDHRRGGLPVLVYFHGGGFTFNSVDTHERLMRLLAERSGVAVVGVGYTLAPEMRFPGQLDEALTAISWLRRNGESFGLDGSRLGLGGDSAGANLALSATLALRDTRQPLPAFGLLLYGMFSADLDSPSHRTFGGGGFGLTTERVDWFWSQYLADRAQRDNPQAAPLLADLHNLPPQIIVGAGLDCLLDDSLNLAERLRAAGVDTSLSVHAGVPHSFMQMSACLAPADTAISQAAASLSYYLSQPIPLAAE